MTGAVHGRRQQPVDCVLLHSAPGLFYCMKSRKLGDAMFFFEEMKRRGIAPDVSWRPAGRGNRGN